MITVFLLAFSFPIARAIAQIDDRLPLDKSVQAVSDKSKYNQIVNKLHSQKTKVETKVIDDLQIFAGNRKWVVRVVSGGQSETLSVSELGPGYILMPYENRSENIPLVIETIRHDLGGLSNQSKVKLQDGLSKMLPVIYLQPVRQLIGHSTVKYSPGGGGAINASLAAKFLNGKVVQPGQVFSFNDAVGPRTKERGFAVSRSIVGDTWVPDVGGGVCRTSTALYQAVLSAGLNVLERQSHSLPVSYTSEDLDAAVSYGNVDLRFKNTKEFPILIKTSSTNQSVTIELWMDSF